jgi:hypothetical protein
MEHDKWQTVIAQMVKFGICECHLEVNINSLMIRLYITGFNHQLGLSFFRKRILSSPIRTGEYPVDDLDFSKKNLRLKKIHMILFKKERKENVNRPATLSLQTSSF